MIKKFWRVALACAALATCAALVPSQPAQAAPAKINGSGSTYVGPAMSQWVADAQTDGLSINYLPTGSPQGLTQFSQSLIDFAGTEAEYSALGGGDPTRGFQYVPDVAGAVAIMYNLTDKAGRKVDYLHLSRETVARIFMGDISKWSDPAIKADNGGLEFPDQDITVVYRGGQSGTTALFYDFVQHVEPQKFSSWAGRNQLPTSVRIIQLDSAPNFAPKTLALNGSDQIAQYVASAQGKWAIAYDEFGYAKTYGAQSAWIKNASGNFVLPYATNISAALEGARLRPDLSQDLAGVYNSQDEDAYPISAYSYIVTECAPSGERATCKKKYDNPGVAETLSKWMRYIACDGQVNMARIGFSPLPPHLSQEMANSIGRMNGEPPETLTKENCSNPRFRGSLGAGAASPKDPLAGKVPTIPANGGSSNNSSGGSSNNNSSSAGGTNSGGSSSSGGGGGSGNTVINEQGQVVDAATGEVIDDGTGTNASAAKGGSSVWRSALPVAYRRGKVIANNAIPSLLLILVMAGPPLAVGQYRRSRRASSSKWL